MLFYSNYQELAANNDDPTFFQKTSDKVKENY